MTWNFMFVAIGGFLGASARYGLSTWSNRRFPSILPRATLFINISGSFLLGFLVGGNWGNPVSMTLGTGFMGAYTTFSTFNVENIQLARRKEWKALIIYVGLSYVAGIALAYGGYAVGTLMKG